jgi:hypothetical protein
VIPLNLLPRLCPVCRGHTIIGHGRRLRPAHDDLHSCIWIRRGICHPCRITFTVLPRALAPSAPFSVRCRQLACEQIAAGEPVEQSAPDCRDPSRSLDASTLRRWAHRRLLSLACWLKAGVTGEPFFRSPTILAWDFSALCRILSVEARSP